MLRHLAITTALLGACALTGCGSSGSGANVTGSTTASLNTQEDAVDQGVSQSTDAATQYLVQQSTSSSGSSGAVTNGKDKPDLSRMSTAGGLVTFSSLVDGNGAALYPNLSGSFTVTASGSAVNSWPTGSSAMANITVTVTVAAPGITYTDPLSGAKATLTSGSFTFDLITTFNGVVGNWTLSTETSTSVPSTTPLSWTITGAGGNSHTVSLTGYRHVLWNFARTTTTTAPVTNNLVVSRTISGVPLSGTSTPDGVAANPATPTVLYTNWVHTVDGGTTAGGSQSTWNRYATWSVTWDFTQVPFKRSLTNFSETIFITRNGVTTQTNSLLLGASVGG